MPVACFFFAFFLVLAEGGSSPFVVTGRIATTALRQDDFDARNPPPEDHRGPSVPHSRRA